MLTAWSKSVCNELKFKPFPTKRKKELDHKKNKTEPQNFKGTIHSKIEKSLFVTLQPQYMIPCHKNNIRR